MATLPLGFQDVFGGKALNGTACRDDGVNPSGSFPPLVQGTQVKLSKHRHQGRLEEEHLSDHAAWELGEALDLE